MIINYIHKGKAKLVRSEDVGKINRTDQCYKYNAHGHVSDQEDGMRGVFFFTPNMCHAVSLGKPKTIYMLQYQLQSNRWY
jgi:hypothetical protein